MPHRPPHSPKDMAALTERYFEMPPFDQSAHFDIFPAFSQWPADALLEDAAAAYAESANYDRFPHAAAATTTTTTTTSYPSSMPQMTSLAPASNASAGSAIFSSPADYPLALAAPYGGLKSELGLAAAVELPASAISWVSGASLPSAASSALGSPSSAVSQTLARPDPWSTDIEGLAIAGIGQDGLVAATALGQDVALTAADGKGPAGFVGESAAVSSSSSSSPPSSASSHCSPSTTCSIDRMRRRWSSASAFVCPSHAPLRPLPLPSCSSSSSSACPPLLAAAYPFSPSRPRDRDRDRDREGATSRRGSTMMGRLYLPVPPSRLQILPSQGASPTSPPSAELVSGPPRSLTPTMQRPAADGVELRHSPFFPSEQRPLHVPAPILLDSSRVSEKKKKKMKEKFSRAVLRPF